MELKSPIYKPLLKHDTKMEQIKNRITKRMQHLRQAITPAVAIKKNNNPMEFTSSYSVRENWYKMFYMVYNSIYNG